jgi:hypothetical protein
MFGVSASRLDCRDEASHADVIFDLSNVTELLVMRLRFPRQWHDDSAMLHQGEQEGKRLGIVAGVHTHYSARAEAGMAATVLPGYNVCQQVLVGCDSSVTGDSSAICMSAHPLK